MRGSEYRVRERDPFELVEWMPPKRGSAASRSPRRSRSILSSLGVLFVFVLSVGCASSGETAVSDESTEIDLPVPLISPAPGIIEFEGKNLFRTVHHTFERWQFSGLEINRMYGEGAKLSGEIEIEIDLTSVETGNEWLNGRARSEEFLDVEHFPISRLWIGEVRPLEGLEEEAAGGKSPAPTFEGQRFIAELEIDLKGVRHREELVFEVISDEPLVVAGEVVLSRTVFSIGPPFRWFNPFAIRDGIAVRFETALPEASNVHRPELN